MVHDWNFQNPWIKFHELIVIEIKFLVKFHKLCFWTDNQIKNTNRLMSAQFPFILFSTAAMEVTFRAGAGRTLRRYWPNGSLSL